MIPTEYKQDIIQSGINFIRSITEAYGSDEGIKLWENIASVLDPDVKGQIFIAMLTGEYNSVVSISGYVPNSNRITMIKAIRNVDSRRLGLKEAKDMTDELYKGTAIKLEVNPKKRALILLELRDAGFYV